jgi:two-component system LytT family sensor kinase
MTGIPDASADIDHAATDRMIYPLWAAFWLLMLIVAVQDVLHSQYIRLWEPLLWEGSSALTATIVLILQRRVDRSYAPYLDRPWLWLGHHFKWFPLIAVCFIASIYAIRHGIYAAVGRSYHHESWTFIAVYESIKLLLYMSLWLGVIFGLHSFSRWRSQHERLLTLQKTLAEAQLSQLRAQLHPHFLFNALNTVSSLMHADVDRADRLLARLGELLRRTLQSSNQEITSLQDELKLLVLYADVMQERFPDRVSISWQVPPDLNTASIPSLLLQPLLENAFKHGVEKSSAPVQVSIEARRNGDTLHIAIRNTGSTLPANPRQGVGLGNSRERLRVIYGSAAKLELAQRDSDIEASVTLPLREYVA